MLAKIIPKRREGRIRVVLAGPYYKGNLKGFREWTLNQDEKFAQCRYYPTEFGHGQWQRALPFAINPLNPLGVLWAARADVMMTNYNNARLARIFRKFAPSIVLAQTSHAVPFFSEKRDFFEKLNVYDAVFAPSEWVRDKFFLAGGLEPGKVRVTGFASLDVLTQPVENKYFICCENDILSDKLTVLIAPTLVFTPGMDPTIVPFGLDEYEYFTGLNDWALKHEAQVIVRPHHFTRLDTSTDFERVFFRPANQYPDAQQLLRVTDVLITDWSAIGIYFLIRKCPIIFQDVPPPASDGLAALGAVDRAGHIATDMTSLMSALDEAVLNPAQHITRFREARERVIEKSFGKTFDGLSAERYYRSLLDLIAEKVPARAKRINL